MLFKPDNYQWLDEFLLSHKGAVRDFKEEWGWFRYQVGGKMFAATCSPENVHEFYGQNVITLKTDPLTNDFLCRQYEDIRPGFYMNKQNWISIDLDGNVPQNVILELCENSYKAVFNKLTKKSQNEIDNT